MAVRLDTSRLDAIIRQEPEKSAQLVKAGAFAVQGEAAKMAPVDTGALSNSIHAEQKSAYLWWVMDGVEYGIYQELGTSRMRAQPFMVPAVLGFEAEYIRSWKELFK